MKTPNHKRGSLGAAERYGKKADGLTAAQKMEEQYFHHPRMDETSPFRNGEVDARLKYTPELSATPWDGIATVTIKGTETEDNPFGKAEYVRVECLHWAPRAEETQDCRFACEQRSAA